MSNTKQRTVPLTALLLNPLALKDHLSCLQLLRIHRTDKSFDFEAFPLHDALVEKYFPSYPQAFKELLAKFNDEDIRHEANLRRKKRQHSGISPEVFIERQMMSYFSELLESLKPYAPDLKFYHITINPQTGNVLMAPCKLHGAFLTLGFEVVKTDAGLEAVPVFYDGDARLAPKGQRIKFLVVLSNTYYQLRHSDFLKLEWLEQRRQEDYALSEALFAERIVQPLEETHEVNRNGHFSKNEIKTAPVSCIYLSEIGESMLMLTPKWKYDGLLIDTEFKPIHQTTRNGILYEVHRDQEKEQALMALLQSLHPSFQQPAAFYYLPFAEARKKQWFLKAYQRFIAEDVEPIGIEMLRHFRYSPHSPETAVVVLKEQDGTTQIQLTITFGQEVVPLQVLQKLLLQGQHNVLLKDNAIGVFPDEWLAEFALLIKHGKALSSNELLVPNWLFLSLKQGHTRTRLSGGMQDEWLQKWQQWQDTEAHIYNPPSALKAQLRGYQQKGFEWMTLLAETGAGACLADDMGLGKTLQTIAFILKQLEDHPQAKFLIVCPASLIYNWQREFAQFAPGAITSLHNGSNRKDNDFLSSEATVVITSYGTLRADVALLETIYWHTVVLDESHNIKNVNSLTTKAATQLRARCRIALSGTPVMNNTLDLYAQLNFLLPGLFPGQEFFRKEYAIPIDRDQDKAQISALQQLTAPFILRRTKGQVATDLPEKTESVLWCELGEEQRRAYEEIREQIQDSLFIGIRERGFGQSKLGVLQGIQKLRQVCASPALLPGNGTDASIKISMLLEELEQLKGNKALVFSQFKGMLHLIAKGCAAKGISFYHFDGDTPLAARSEMVARFQEPGNDTRVFLISLKAGNSGLNLTAADYVFLVDPWWNTAVQQQAIDRTHRIGQTRNVIAYKMICKDTIEEKIMALQQRKQHLSDELIGDESGFVKNLTEEDVAYLFG